MLKSTTVRERPLTEHNLRGVLTDAQIRLLRERNDERRETAIAALGSNYLLYATRPPTMKGQSQ
jgi:hypothetical protein